MDNAKPGAKITVTFTVNDRNGNAMDISKLDFLNLVLTGPTSDYNGYISEDARKADAGRSRIRLPPLPPALP